MGDPSYGGPTPIFTGQVYVVADNWILFHRVHDSVMIVCLCYLHCMSLLMNCLCHCYFNQFC